MSYNKANCFYLIKTYLTNYTKSLKCRINTNVVIIQRKNLVIVDCSKTIPAISSHYVENSDRDIFNFVEDLETNNLMKSFIFIINTHCNKLNIKLKPVMENNYKLQGTLLAFLNSKCNKTFSRVYYSGLYKIIINSTTISVSSPYAYYFEKIFEEELSVTGIAKFSNFIEDIVKEYYSDFSDDKCLSVVLQYDLQSFLKKN